MTAPRVYLFNLLTFTALIAVCFADDQQVNVPSVAPSVNEDFFALDDTPFPTLSVTAAPSPVPTSMTEEEFTMPSVSPTFDDWDLAAEDTLGPTVAETRDPTPAPTFLTQEEIIAETAAPTVSNVKVTTSEPSIRNPAPVTEPTVEDPVDDATATTASPTFSPTHEEADPLLDTENNSRNPADISAGIVQGSSDKDLSAGAIIGIVLGVGVFVTVVLALFYWRSTDRKDEEEGVLEVPRTAHSPSARRYPGDMAC